VSEPEDEVLELGSGYLLGALAVEEHRARHVFYLNYRPFQIALVREERRGDGLNGYSLAAPERRFYLVPLLPSFPPPSP
jgi:hypothetical protein